MSASEDIAEKLAALEDRTNAATPYVRISGDLLRAAIAEIRLLRAELAGRQVRVMKTIFDDGSAT